MSHDYWQQLGIEPTTDLAVIRQAYRKKLPLHHPESDPLGFQTLRAAYESALRYAENPTSLIEPENDVDSDTDSEKSSDPLQETIAQLTQEYQQLLSDPKRCYSIDEWHLFINRLDLYPIEVTHRLCWPLLEVSYDTPNLSYHCLAILAERMRWRQRLAELDAERVHEYDDYLSFIDRPDEFDFFLLRDLDRPVQEATVSYVNMIRSIYWNRPINELAYFLELPTVLYLPDDETLKEKMVRWHALANVGCEALLEFSAQKLQQFPDNPDWLYLTARQYALLDKKQQAFDHWLQLYRSGHYTEQSSAWLIFWCSQYEPDYVPLLIQAMNDAVALDPNIADFDDERHPFVIPQQTPTTLMRLTNAASLSLSPLSESFLKWSQSEDQNYRWVLSLLLQDDGSRRQLRLYRHAVMLSLGNERLLEQIIDEPESGTPLENLILSGLKRQAAQQLNWLTHSPALKVFTQWLYSEKKALPLPDIFSREERSLRFYMTAWLNRLRYIPNHVIQRLQEDPAIPGYELGMFDWISNLSYNNDIRFNAPKDEQDPESYWQWYRQYIALLAMVIDPIANFDYFHSDTTLCVDKKSPLNKYIAVMQSVHRSDTQCLADQIYAAISAQTRLDWVIVNDLPVSPQAYLRDCDISSFDDLYRRCVNEWASIIEHSCGANQLLLKTIFLQQPFWQESPNFQQQINDIMFNHPELETLNASLVSGQVYPYNIESDPLCLSEVYRHIMQADGAIAHSDDYLFDSATVERLSSYRDDAHLDIVLRLCAGLLLLWHSLRCEQQGKKWKAQSHFWQVWRWNSRLGRLGMFEQLVIGSGLLGFFYDKLPSILASTDQLLWLKPVVLLLFALNVISAAKRRINDLGYSPSFSCGLLIISLICSPVLLILMFLKGEKGINKYGPPPLD
jgi:uncharacterized membrane protein YhaH (DUF805 family)